MQWFYSLNSQRQGPVSQAEFDKLIAENVIKSDTLVWREGMAEWQPYAKVAAGATAAVEAGDDTAVCVVSGKRHPKREMIQYEGQWISAEHRDAYFQRLREGVAQPGASTVPGPFGYGGFWRRFVARFVDGIVSGVAGMFIGGLIGGIFGATGLFRPGDRSSTLVMQGVVQIVMILLVIAYEIYFIRKFDATPGKLAMGMKLYRANGDKLSKGRIVGRYFANYLSALMLLIGYIMAGFDEEKRALHDRVCDTRVVKTR